MTKIILDLCGGTSAWSKPYKDAGYDVRNITLPEYDVRTYIPPDNIYGILAAPPCDHFAVSGARWWKRKGEKALLEGLSIVDACLRIILISKPKFWALENPVGRLRKYIGNPQFVFQPYDFGDPYTKKTYLWGKFNIPIKNPIEPIEGSKMQYIPPGIKQKELRSITPQGFAKAFFEANK
jgi:hypothetical protein